MASVLLILLVLPVLGFVLQQLATWLDGRRVPPPGRLVTVSGRSVHLWEQGVSGPLVLFEAGIAASSINWAGIQRTLAAGARTVSYDRLGFGWSDAPASRRELKAIAEEFLATLDAAGLDRVLLVAHSYGGMLATVAAALHPERLLGVVLVDPLHPREYVMPTPGQAAMLRGGAFLARWGALLASVGFVRFNLFLVSLRIPFIPKLAARLSSGGAGSGLVERMVGQVKKMPEDLHPAVRAHWAQAKPFRTMASYLENLPLSSAQAATTLAGLKRPIPLPCIVISGAHAGERELEWHRSLAELFAQAEHRIAPQGGHWVQLDHPETVIAAIRELARPR